MNRKKKKKEERKKRNKDDNIHKILMTLKITAVLGGSRTLIQPAEVEFKHFS